MALVKLTSIVDSLRPPRAAGRAAFQLRFIVGSSLIGSLVAIPTLVVSLARGEVVSASLIAGFLTCIVAQLIALRRRASVSVLSVTMLSTLGVFLVLAALQTREFVPEQLPWLAHIPLAALVLAGPRADDDSARTTGRPVLLALLATLGAAGFVVLAHRFGWTFDEPADTPMWVSALNFALWLLSAFGLLYLYDLSARETQAELRQLRQILSMCAWCRKVNDSGAWVTVDSYLSKRHLRDLSHGICPACMQQHYPDDDPP